MSSTLRRSQHHQRRKEQAIIEPDSASFANPRPRITASTARPAATQTSGRWTPWVLDSKGDFHWSAMRNPDGSVEYAYADTTGSPIRSSSPLSVQRIGAHSHGIVPRLRSSPSVPSVPSSPSLTLLSTSGSSRAMSSSAGSYLKLYLQDMQHEGAVGERRKLDLRVARWLASLA